MCILTGPVRQVSKTKIFVMPSSFSDDGFPQQLTVYSNSVQTPAENLMILPVPWPDSIEFQEQFMKSYADIFHDCETSLYDDMPKTLSVTRSLPNKANLHVFDVGSYRVSIVPSVDDFSRLNGAVFSLRPELKEMLVDVYSKYSIPIGFICCKLRAGQQTYEPLAYTHRRWKLDSLFVPTRHYHAEVSERELYGFTYFGEALTVSGQRALEEKPHWDHSIYSLRTKPFQAHQSNKMPKERNCIKSDLLPYGFSVSPGEKVHCWEKVGPWENLDLELRLTMLEIADRDFGGR